MAVISAVRRTESVPASRQNWMRKDVTNGHVSEPTWTMAKGYGRRFMP